MTLIYQLLFECSSHLDQSSERRHASNLSASKYDFVHYHTEGIISHSACMSKSLRKIYSIYSITRLLSQTHQRVTSLSLTFLIPINPHIHLIYLMSKKTISLSSSCTILCNGSDLCTALSCKKQITSFTTKN